METYFDKIINRYAYKDSTGQNAALEINLQKVRIVKYLDWTKHSIYEVVQFSKTDTISDLYSRLIVPENSESEELWMIIYFNDPCNFFMNGIKEYEKQKSEFKSIWKKVKSTNNNVMSLGLNKLSLLIIIEDLKAKVCKSTPIDIHEEDKENFFIPDDNDWAGINKILNSSQEILYATGRKTRNSFNNHQEENKKKKTSSEKEIFNQKDDQSFAYQKSTSFNRIVQNHYFIFIKYEYWALTIY